MYLTIEDQNVNLYLGCIVPLDLWWYKICICALFHWTCGGTRYVYVHCSIGLVVVQDMYMLSVNHRTEH